MNSNTIDILTEAVGEKSIAVMILKDSQEADTFIDEKIAVEESIREFRKPIPDLEKKTNVHELRYLCRDRGYVNFERKNVEQLKNMLKYVSLSKYYNNLIINYRDNYSKTKLTDFIA